MNSELHVAETPEAAGAALANLIANRLRQAAAEGREFHLALSGGKTPIPFFDALCAENDLPWQQLWLYWSDERCVPPNDPDSNYGLARKHLLSKIHVPKGQIERLRGEVDPEAEAARYSALLRQRLPASDAQPEAVNAPPVLDCVVLGLGDDGHTASLFPGDDDALVSSELLLGVIHPQSGQLRLTMTPALMNAAREVVFFVTGSSKAKILNQVRQSAGTEQTYPAQAIRPEHLHWFVDQAATSP